ncbi:MAG: thermonuclease family protein [Chloroflexota bacterium]
MNSIPHILATLLLLMVFLAVGGWQGAGQPQPQAPSGCQAVYAATTRGGASHPSGGASCSLLPPANTVLVRRVVDGDTIVLASGERVRYIGVDTPEVTGTPQFFGPEASEANRRLVEGRQVRLGRDVSDRDGFDRLLRYVYVDGVMVNAELVREGFATSLVYPPDTRYAQCFSALEEEARESGRGMWGR